MSEDEKYAALAKKWGWFFGAVLAATGLQWQFPQLRGGSFTIEDHKPWEERILNLEQKVAKLPPHELLVQIAEMKGELVYIRNTIEGIKQELNK